MLFYVSLASYLSYYLQPRTWHQQLKCPRCKCKKDGNLSSMSTATQRSLRCWPIIMTNLWNFPLGLPFIILYILLFTFGVVVTPLAHGLGVLFLTIEVIGAPWGPEEKVALLLHDIVQGSSPLCLRYLSRVHRCWPVVILWAWIFHGSIPAQDSDHGPGLCGPSGPSVKAWSTILWVTVNRGKHWREQASIMKLINKCGLYLYNAWNNTRTRHGFGVTVYTCSSVTISLKYKCGTDLWQLK